MPTMRIAYELRTDTDWISKVQKATLGTKEFGIEPTHGVFGSSEWWEQISSGWLPLQTLTGVITKRYMGSMGDWPEIEVRGDSGDVSHWTRNVNAKERDRLYIPGQRIEIHYVMQRHRPKSFDHGAEFKQVIEIRVEPSASPGAYEKVRATEIAQAILLRYSVLLEGARELAELGKVTGVMDEESRRVFSQIADEIQATRTRTGADSNSTAILDRCRVRVLSICKGRSKT
jgi:hypothetical protein